MTFAMWWSEHYPHTGDVPDRYFDMMREAYDQGKKDENEACAKFVESCDAGTIEFSSCPALSAAIRMRSNKI